MTFTDLLGETLQGKDGKTIPTADALADKEVVGLYFSAHWCGPCRGFTPVLAKSYLKIVEKHKFEIIFVSSDRDDKSFDEYFAEMPWLSLPYANREAKAKLSKKFKVQGIPTLVLLDGKTGKTITRDGRETITEDGEGEKFPWIKPRVSLFDLLGENLVGKSGQTTTKSVFESSDAVGLYFSAHWCGPCRGFTPKLADSYNQIKKDGKHKFEIIFVSSDSDQKSFDEYFGEMPWLALPYENRDSKTALSTLFEVEGIPTFVILDKNGKIINKDGRGAVSGDPQGADFPWVPKPVNSISSPDGINDTPSLVLFTEKADAATQTALRADLHAVANEILSKVAKPEDDDEQPERPALFFFAENENDSIAKRVRQLISLGEPTSEPQAALLDLADSGAYYTFPTGEQINKQSLQKFVEDFLAGSLKSQRKQLN